MRIVRARLAIGARVERIAVQTIGAGLSGAVSFDTVNDDPLGMFDAARPTQLTIRQAGTYRVRALVHLDGAAGVRAVAAEIRKNGGTVAQTVWPPAGDRDAHIPVTIMDRFVAGDVLDLIASYQPDAMGNPATLDLLANPPSFLAAALTGGS